MSRSPFVVNAFEFSDDNGGRRPFGPEVCSGVTMAVHRWQDYK
jgi:hypothetical protein